MVIVTARGPDRSRSMNERNRVMNGRNGRYRGNGKDSRNGRANVRIAAFLSGLILSGIFLSGTAFAGQWKNGADDPESWWYDHLDGTYAVGWELIDGNADGMGEWYFFDEDGWLITDYLTKDGYELDKNGAWVVNGAVVRQRMDSGAGTSTAGSGVAAGNGAGAQTAGNAGQQQSSAADIPSGKYRLNRLIYNDGSSRGASSDRTWYLECAPWGEGMMTAFSSVEKSGRQTLRYQEFRKESGGVWVSRGEEGGEYSGPEEGPEEGPETRLIWNRETDTIDVRDADLTRYYVRN